MLEDVNPEGPAPSPEPGLHEVGRLASELADAVPVVDGSILPTPPLHPTSNECEPVEDEAASEASESNYAAPLEEEEDSARSGQLADWKDALRRDFEKWLEDLDDSAELEEAAESEDAGPEASETPDLYSFYEQLAAANSEFRKANRRTAEAISQWCETLTRFDGSLSPLRETMAKLTAAQPKADELSRSHCLVLVEWLDRLNRIRKAFESPPQKTSWWQGRGNAAWLKAWETQGQALAILASHIEELLRAEGVTRLGALGQPFDPATMTAVAAEPDSAHPPQTVLEELAAGYRRHGELLRTAQVKVSRQP
jgi:hypothetical protein